MDTAQSYVTSSTQLHSASQTSGALSHTSNSIPTYPSHNSNYIQYPSHNAYQNYYNSQQTQQHQKTYYPYQQNSWNEYANASAPPPPPGVSTTQLPAPATVYPSPYPSVQYPTVSQKATHGQVRPAGVQATTANSNQVTSLLLYYLSRSVVLNLSWSVAPLPRFSVPVAPWPVCLSQYLNIVPPVKSFARGPPVEKRWSRLISSYNCSTALCWLMYVAGGYQTLRY